MGSQSGIAAGAPIPDPSELTMLNAGYSPQTTAAAQRSQDLAQALAEMRERAQNIRTPIAAGADPLADALLNARYAKTNAAPANAYANQQPASQNIGQLGMSTVDTQPFPLDASGVDYDHALASLFGGVGLEPHQAWNGMTDLFGGGGWTSDDPISPALQAGAPQARVVTFDDLIPALQADAPQYGRVNFDDLVPSQGAPWQPSSTGPASALPDASTRAGAAVDSSLDGITLNPGAPPGMRFARYLVQPDETVYGGALGNTDSAPSGSPGGGSPLLPRGAVVLQTQLDTSPSVLAAMSEPVYRYDHTFNSLTDVHPDRSTSRVVTPGGSMHIWNSSGDNIDSPEYDASTQRGYVSRAYYDAYTGEYLGSYGVVNDGVPFRLPNGTVVQYDPAPTLLDKLSSAWSDSWLGQAARETWDDIAGGALGGEGALLDSAATAASAIPTAVRLLLTGGAEGGGALGMPSALRAGQLAEADQLAALGSAGKIAVAPSQGGAKFGTAVSNDYRATFFEAHPELEGQVVVHHAVEQQVLARYPGLVSEAEMHSLENLRGIPNELNSDLHVSQIRREWNQFYRENPSQTRQQLLQKAAEIDAKYGSQFEPPVGPQR